MAFTRELRVLYVDDDADCCGMLSTLLKLSQIETHLATSAAQALTEIQEKYFDLYLLEARLPGLDGFELCRRIRAVDADTPILFYSGAAYEADKQRGIQAGAAAYVAKPDIDALLLSITRYFPHSKAADA